MSKLYFDVWPAADPNGTALGELSQAYNKKFRLVHQAMGEGGFTINLHDSQAAWAATDNLVRVRRVAGGPFAYNDARYVGAFWIEQGDDVVLAAAKGLEELTRGGRTAEACLRWAVLYPDASYPGNAKFTTHTRDDGNWHIDDRGGGEVMAIGLRDAEARAAEPLPFVSRDFGVSVDSTSTPWSDTDTKWQLPVGTNLLDLLGTCVAGGMFYRMGADLELHAYEEEPGDDLTATLVLTKGVKGPGGLTESAQRQVHAPLTVSRVIMQGTKESGQLKYREVVDATTEAALPFPREGYAEFRRTPTNAKLDRAGMRHIRKQKRRHDGPATVRTVEGAGVVALVDYVPGDVLTIDVPGVWDELERRIYAVALEENTTGECDPVLELEQSPFNPADNRDGELTDPPGGPGGGKPHSCGDCPPLPPFEPCANPGEGWEPAAFAGIMAVQDASGTSGTLTFDQEGDAPGSGWFAMPSSAPLSVVQSAQPFSQITTSEPILVRIEARVGSSQALIGPASMTVDLKVNGATVASDTQTTSDPGAHAWTPVHYIDVPEIALSPGDVVSLAFSGTRDNFWTNSTNDIYLRVGRGQHFWNSGTVEWNGPGDDGGLIPDAVPCVPLEGQGHVEQHEGVAEGEEYELGFPYAPGSLVVTVGGLHVVATEVDPAAGTFTLPVDATGALVLVHYQNAGTTPTGGGGAYPDGTYTYPPHTVLGSGGTGSGDRVLGDDGAWHLAGSAADIEDLDRAAGLAAQVNIETDAVLVQETGWNRTGGAGTASVTLGATPTVGNLLVLVVGQRGPGSTPSTPAGFTSLGTVEGPSFDGGTGTLFYRFVTGPSEATTYSNTHSSSTGIYVAELSGIGSFGAVATANNVGASTSMVAGPSSLGTGDLVALGLFAQSARDGSGAGGVAPDYGWPAGWTREVNAGVDGSGPSVTFAWKPLPGHSGTLGATVTATNNAGYGWILATFSGIADAWASGAATVDGNDATYVATTIADAFWRVDLGAAYAVTSARARVGFDTAASRQLTLQGATDLAFTSPVTLGTLTLTSTGSYTGDEFAIPVVAPQALRYYRLVAAAEYAMRVYTVELVEARNLAEHIAAADPHAGYQRESEKDVASGYAGLDSSGRVPVAELAALSWKHYVRCATTAAITISTGLNSGDTIDGVTLADGDRVLVKDQAAPAENGIYVVGASPARAADMSAADEVLGAATMVIAGTVNAGRLYYVSSPVVAPTVGTTAIAWSRLGGASSLTVEEVDGSPTDATVTKLVFPNDTVSIAAGVATVAAAPPRGFVGFRGSGSGISVPTGTYPGTAWAISSETWDTDGFHSGSGTTLTIPAGLGGKYRVNTIVEWASNSSGERLHYIMKNGSQYGPFLSRMQANATFDHTVAGSTEIDLVPGDTISITGYHTRGSSLNVQSFYIELSKLDSGKAGGAIGAKAYNSTTQSVPDNTTTPVALNTEEYDTDGFHDNSTNNSRFTIPAGLSGTYKLTGGTTYDTNTSGIRYGWWRKNGSTDLRGETIVKPDSNGCSVNIEATVALVAGDYVEFVTHHTGSSGARTIGHASGAAAQSWASITRLDSGSGAMAVVASASSTAGQNMVNGAALAVVNFGTVATDTHAEVHRADRRPVPSQRHGVLARRGWLGRRRARPDAAV
jgi:hypothetical protein